MYKYFTLLIGFLFISNNINAQFSLDEFLNEQMSFNLKSVKSKLQNKIIEETNILKFKSIVYHDVLSSIKIKVGYLFDDDGTQKGKVIMNANENPSDAEKLMKILLSSLEKKFSTNYSRVEAGHTELYNWRGLKDISVMLSKQDKKTMLTITKK